MSRTIDADALTVSISKYSFYHENDRDMVCEIIRVQPTIEPERPRGKWNRLSDDTFHCLECGKTFMVIQGKGHMSFCPNCGADMREGEQNV